MSAAENEADGGGGGGASQWAYQPVSVGPESSAIPMASVPPTPEEKPRIWPIPLVVLTAFCLHLGMSIFALLVAMVLVNGTLTPDLAENENMLQGVTQSRLGLSLTLIVPQATMVIPVVVAAILSPVGFRERLGLVRGRWPLRLWLSAAIATPIVGLVSSMIVGGLMGESESLNEMSDIFRGLGQGGFFIPLAMMVGLTPGIFEELLFRGYVQTRLVQRLGPVLAILLTSLAFAAFHMDLVHSTAVIAIGVYLGWLSWSSGSLFPAMIGHFVNNFLSVAAVVFLPDSMLEPGVGNPEDVPPMAALAMLVIVFASVVAFVYTLLQARKLRRADAGSSPPNDGINVDSRSPVL